MSDERNNRDLERRLKAALRPLDPGAGFAAGVQARIAAEGVRPLRSGRSRATASWLTFVLAASVVLGLFIAHERQVQRTEQGLEARRQLIQALRVTGEKLELASRAVNTSEHSTDSSHSGA
jgi:hypothetical protein